MPRAATRMFLTHDEELEARIGDRGDTARFRCRIWRGKGRASLVLLSPLPDGPSPLAYATRLATHVVRRFLEFGEFLCIAEDNGTLFNCRFDWPNSRVLIPRGVHAVLPAIVEDYIGNPIEVAGFRNAN